MFVWIFTHLTLTTNYDMNKIHTTTSKTDIYSVLYQKYMVRIIQNYTLYEVIGEGAYGKVYRAVNKVDGKEYAVKVIEVKKFQTNKKLQQCTVHEINILTNIEKNKHIITYYDMLKTQNNFYFVYEYCNGGTLEGLLRKEHALEEKKALLILKQLLQAFQVLNKYNIMHRDLKPDNIFFHNGILKVGDFGFCKSLQKAEMTKTMLGSPIYMAPQILNGQIYSNKADIWSIGVVLYEMLYGYCPFESNSIPKLIEVLKETQLQMPSEVLVSNQTKQLLRKILTKDPLKRIEWMELFQLKISNDGKIGQQKSGRLSLVDDNKNIFRTVKQVSENNDQIPYNPISPQTYPKSNNYINSYSSPKNMLPNEINKSQKGEQKGKVPFMKKNHNQIQQAQNINISPMKKNKSADLKAKTIKFHEDIIKGIVIARSLGFNNDKNTPLFSYFLFKSMSQRLKLFREDELQNPDLKQIRQVVDQEIDDIDAEIAMMRGRVEEHPDWKKGIKSKVLQFKNIRLCYQLVMYLSGQSSVENASHSDMSYAIRNKLA